MLLKTLASQLHMHGLTHKTDVARVWAAPVHLPALCELLQAVVEFRGDHHGALELGVHLNGNWIEHGALMCWVDRNKRCVGCRTIRTSVAAMH